MFNGCWEKPLYSQLLVVEKIVSEKIYIFKCRKCHSQLRKSLVRINAFKRFNWAILKWENLLVSTINVAILNWENLFIFSFNVQRKVRIPLIKWRIYPKYSFIINSSRHVLAFLRTLMPWATVRWSEVSNVVWLKWVRSSVAFLHFVLIN